MAVVDFSVLKDKIRDVLTGMHGVSVDKNGFYYTECDKDYRDELEDSQIADVLAGRYRCCMGGKEHVEQMEPQAVLCNILADAYQDEMWRIEDAVLEALRKDVGVAGFLRELGLDEEQTNEKLREALQDVWYVTPPVDDYLRQGVCMDIMLDTGDMNYGFACNNIDFSDIESVEDFDENSSLLWLCEQQGVTREELLAAYDKGSAHSDVVLQLRERKNELTAQLEQLGLQTSSFGERVWHTGAYREFVRLQDTMVKQQATLQTLRGKYEANDLTYQAYLKQHFDRFDRLDPMSGTQFQVRKAEVLESLAKRIEMAEDALAVTQEKLAGSVDYGTIATLQSELRDVVQQLSAAAKTEGYQKAEFIDSVMDELAEWRDNAAVMFLVKMPLEQAIRVLEAITGEASQNDFLDYSQRTGDSFIIIGRDVTCGLMNVDIGGGGLFDISLVKDVEIPVKAIYRAVPDAALGSYGYMPTYGTDDVSYAEALKEIHVAPEKVESLIAAAVDKCETVNKNEPCKDSHLHERG